YSGLGGRRAELLGRQGIRDLVGRSAFRLPGRHRHGSTGQRLVQVFALGGGRCFGGGGLGCLGGGRLGCLGGGRFRCFGGGSLPGRCGRRLGRDLGGRRRVGDRG